MFELVHNDPRGWLRHYLKRNPVPEQAPEATGFVYVLAITGTTSYVKVGSTTRPRARFEALRTEAHHAGAAVTQAWLSPAHPTYQSSEAHALKACRAISASSTPRSEYFPSLDFTTARRETIRAVLGFRNTPRVSTTTQAAGLHEPIPLHVDLRLAPSAWEIDLRQREYFAQGSARTRFRRRNAESSARCHPGPGSDFDRALREFARPSAPVIDLSSRRRRSSTAAGRPV
ncbi:hypothetical protein [Streptomyces sp. bgisy027]|uniref:hypothetical protein n=1 Tax=Streptomyces sp. bgisy027 TaxID=3413770 RepID=UPI003D74C5AC